MLYQQKFLIALILTLVSELPVVFVLIIYLYKYKNIKTLMIFFVGILASALTLPYLWFVLPAFVYNRNIYLIVGETSVILIEAIIYWRLLKLKLIDSLIVSLLANVTSIITGILLIK